MGQLGVNWNGLPGLTAAPPSETFAWAWEVASPISIPVQAIGRVDVGYDGACVGSVIVYADTILAADDAEEAAAILLNPMFDPTRVGFSNAYLFGLFGDFQDFAPIWPQNAGWRSAENPTGKFWNVIVSTTRRGLPFLAGHQGCSSADIVLCPDGYSTYPGIAGTPYASPSIVMGMFDQEAVEVFQAKVPNWSDCDVRSFGEGFSHAHAAERCGFDNRQYALAWLDSPRQNFLSINPPSYPATGENMPAIACNAIGIFWLRHLGFSFRQIVQAWPGSSCLAQVWSKLTGNPDGSACFPVFAADVEKVCPAASVPASASLNLWG